MTSQVATSASAAAPPNRDDDDEGYGRTTAEWVDDEEEEEEDDEYDDAYAASGFVADRQNHSLAPGVSSRAPGAIDYDAVADAASFLTWDDASSADADVNLD